MKCDINNLIRYVQKATVKYINDGDMVTFVENIKQVLLYKIGGIPLSGRCLLFPL